MILPTKLGLSLLAGVFAMYLVSVQGKSGLVVLIIGILLGMFVMNAFMARRAARSLRLVPPARISCTEGEHLRDAWTVENPSDRAAGLAEVTLPWGTLFRVNAIPAGDSAHLTPELPMPYRGVFGFSDFKVISAYPFGLFECRLAVTAPGEILVYPRPYPTSSAPASGYEPMVGGRYSGQNKSSTGDQFHGVRPMAAGDPVKLIHWPSSSKGQEIMVREFDEQLSGRLVLVMDAEPGNAPNGELMLNWSARAGASLMLAGLDAGHQVEVALLGQEDILSVPPFADGEVVLAALARWVPAKGSLSREHLLHTLNRAPRKAALGFILTQVNAEFIAFVREELVPTRRRWSLYLPSSLRDQELPFHVPVTYFDADQMEEV